jgi:hypothetical protein
MDASQIYWSASLCRKGEGDFPPIIIEHSEVKSFIQRQPLGENFVISKVQGVHFTIGPDLRSDRWQLQWIFGLASTRIPRQREITLLPSMSGM